MAEWHQPLYDDYVREYGKPKLPKHLIAYSKKHGRESLKFAEAKLLLTDNKNNEREKKKSDKTKTKSKSNSKPKAKAKAKGKDEAKHSISMNNNKRKEKAKGNTTKEKAKTKKKNNASTVSSIFGSLSAAITPLSSVKPIEVTQKTDIETISKPFDGNDSVKDRENEMKYKTKKNKRFKKKKGTGSTPKAIEIEIKTEEKDVAPPLPKEMRRRKLTPIPKKTSGRKSKVLSLASKYDKKSAKNRKNKKKKKKKESKWDRDKEREIVLWMNKRFNQDLIKIGGRKYLQNILENGQLLCRLINKIETNSIDKKVIKQKANVDKYDRVRLECFVSRVKAFGIDNVFDIKVFGVGNDDGSGMMTVLNTLSALKKEIKSRDKGESPLYLWCSYNSISNEILSKLCQSKYDLLRLFSLKSTEIEKTLSNELSLNDKLKLMKCIVRLKQANIDCDEWIVLKEDIYCNLSTKDVLNINKASDAKQFIIPALKQCSHHNAAFILAVLRKYFDEMWFIDELLSVISRIKRDASTSSVVSFIVNNKKKIETIPITESSLFSTDLAEMEATKLSYNLMELLSSGHEIDLISQFIEKYYIKLIFHALCAFVPSESTGNVYHARIVCDYLLDKYPLLMLSTICNDSNPLCIEIQLLLRYAMFTQLDHGNLNSFILELVSFPCSQNDELLSFKKCIISKFISWNFFDHLLSIAPYSSSYALFVSDLLSRCAFDESSHMLFIEKDIISPFICALFDSSLSLSVRITCCQTICAMFDILKMPTLMIETDVLSETDDNKSGETLNYLHDVLFESSVSLIWRSYFPKLCSIVLNEDIESAITINCRVIHRPFGPLRWHCFELIGLCVDLSMLNAAQPLSKLSLSFWERLLDLLFIYCNNNFFLNQFRRLIHLSMLFRRRIFKHLCLNCDLLSRFLSFYHSETGTDGRTELHSFIIQMVWNFYCNDQQRTTTANFSGAKEDQFDILAHFESNAQFSSSFLRIIEFEMNSRVLTQDIDLNVVNNDDIDENDNDNLDLNLNNDDIFNWNPFREEIIEEERIPTIEYMSHFGLFKDYRFDITSSDRRLESESESESDRESMLSISYCFAETLSNELYLMFRWNLNKISINPILERKSSLNLMIVLDHSAKMGHCFNEERISKFKIATQIIGDLYENVLTDSDRFGLISFNHEAYLDYDLNYKSSHCFSVNDGVSSMRCCGECDVSVAYGRASSSFECASSDELNRILFITTQEPQEAQQLIQVMNSVQSNAESSHCAIATTFISLCAEFNLNIISHLFDCRGCNYFHVESRSEFEEINFKNVFNPIYGDVNLHLSAYTEAEADADTSIICNIFGAMMNDNEREYRCASGYIQSVKTLFAHSCDDDYRYTLNGDCRLIEIKNDSKKLKLSIQYQEDEKEEHFTICIPQVMQQQLPYFDNLSIRKAVLLTQYLNLLKQWAQSQNTKQFHVNEHYKAQFKQLMTQFGDDMTLQREIDVCEKLCQL